VLGDHLILRELSTVVTFYLQRSLLQVILKAVQTYVTELRSGVPAQQGSSSSSAAAGAEPTAAAATAAQAGASNGTVSSSGSAAAAAAKPSKSRCTVRMTEKFYARAQDIFECFVVQGRLQAFTRSPAVVEPQPGGTFSWFNGHVQVRAVGRVQAPWGGALLVAVMC
jgi:activator of HSP90 ATPase